MDGLQAVLIERNAFFADLDTFSTRALQAHTDDIVIRQNTWNSDPSGPSTVVGSSSSSTIQFLDALDTTVVSSGERAVTAIVGQYQSTVTGQVTFVRVSNGGSNYRSASVALIGSGAGARATPYIRDGRIIGISLIDGGSGYDSTSTHVVVGGDGTGATAVAFVGLPTPVGRRLAVQCNSNTRFVYSATGLIQSNWTGADISVSAGSEIVWDGIVDGWRAVAFQSVDNIVPREDGSLSIQTLRGDVSISPGPSGRVRLTSSAEAGGILVCLGRGSPEGVVSAPAGSDYRNLDGGAGMTFWLKRTGSGQTGWVAVC